MRYTSIVCGVTGSEHAQRAALEAANMAKEHNAELTYIYAVDSTFLNAGATVELGQHYAEDSMERLGARMLEMAEKTALAQGVTPNKVIRRGSVLEVLKAVVSEQKADLLVLGHEVRTFLEKAIVKGGVEDHIEELKRQTGVEVLVVR
ncbi:MAG: universal stress protein [Syntrophobacteraceae bacterium]